QLERMLFTVDAPSSEILFPQRHVNYSGPETIATLAQTSFQELRRPSPRMASIQLLAPLSSADAIELSKTLISGDRARQDVQQSIMRTKLRLRRGVYFGEQENMSLDFIASGLNRIASLIDEPERIWRGASLIINF